MPFLGTDSTDPNAIFKIPFQDFLKMPLVLPLYYIAPVRFIMIKIMT